MAIGDKNGTPKWIFMEVMHTYIPVNPDRWVIPQRSANNWISSGGGHLTEKDGTLYFLNSEGKYIMRWFDIDFPDDCKQKKDEPFKSGKGDYLSTYSGQWEELEWSNRTIIPEP